MLTFHPQTSTTPHAELRAEEVIEYDGANNVARRATGVGIQGDGSVCDCEQVAADAKFTDTYDPMNRLTALTAPNDGRTPSTWYAYTAPAASRAR